MHRAKSHPPSSPDLASALLITLLAGALALTSTLAGQERGVSSLELLGVPQFEARYALILANDDYKHWADLPGVRTDVRRYEALFTELGYDVRVERNLTADTFHTAMTRFHRDVGTRDHVQILIIYIGHGASVESRSGSPEGYLVPVDAPTFTPGERSSEAEFSTWAYSLTDMSGWARKFKSSQMMMIFDSCFAGTIFSQDRAPSGLAQYDQPVRYVITAGDYNQTVPDQSVFAEWMEAGLRDNSADLDKDGLISGYELGVYLEANVSSDPRTHQTPQKGKISDRDYRKGEFLVKAYEVDPCGPAVAIRPSLARRCVETLKEEMESRERALSQLSAAEARESWRNWIASYGGLSVPLPEYEALIASARAREVALRAPAVGLHFAPVPGSRVEISRTEVSVDQYAACVREGACAAPMGFHQSRWCHYGRPQGGSLPINCVDRAQAEQFASWLGAALPTYEVWLAAAATSQPTCPLSQVASTGAQGPWAAGCGSGGPRPVGEDNREEPVDLYGNVWEWLAPSAKRPSAQIAGGGWEEPSGAAPGSYLRQVDPTLRIEGVGFRVMRARR